MIFVESDADGFFERFKELGQRGFRGLGSIAKHGQMMFGAFGIQLNDSLFRFSRRCVRVAFVSRRDRRQAP